MAKKKEWKKKVEDEEIPAGFEVLHTLRAHEDLISEIAWSPDGKMLASGLFDGRIHLWGSESGELLGTLRGGGGRVFCVAWSPDSRMLASGYFDNTVRVWDTKNEKLLAVLRGHWRNVKAVSWSPDGGTIASGSNDATICLWDTEKMGLRAKIRKVEGKAELVSWSPDGRTIASTGGWSPKIQLWNAPRQSLRKTLGGSDKYFLSFAWSPDGAMFAAGTKKCTIELWEASGRKRLTTLEGHTASVSDVAFSGDGCFLASLGADGTIRLWRKEMWETVAILRGVSPGYEYRGLAFHPKAAILATLAENDREVCVWRLDYDVMVGARGVRPAVHYTNAKVVLVGESGVGKSGLGHRLAEDKWVMTDSTHGMKVWPLELGGQKQKQELGREVWLWDLAGQPDYRLVHQLYFDETALALMLFNPAHPEDPFREVGEWEKGMRTALGHEAQKLLIAARTDVGGATISKEKIEQFCKQRGYTQYFETSAKTGEGCEALREALVKYIPWDKLPSISTNKVFKALKDAVIRLKGEGMVLIQFVALQKQVENELGEEVFEEAELRTVVRLLAGQGLVKQLEFGDFVLLQPEQINNYASAVVREAREHVDGIGTVNEDKVLKGEIDFKNMPRVSQKDEEILLRAMVQMFLEQSLCIREETPEGVQLVFPSQYKRDMPEIPEYPHICVKYKFGGNSAAIYATLVVRLIYSKGFEKKDLWRNAAEFLTEEGRRIGFVMEYLGEGMGEITVFFEEGVPDDTRVTFIKYIHEHLLRRAVDVERQREYVCPKCNKTVENREAIKFRLAQGKKDIVCSYCDNRIVLYDLIEKKFNQDEFLRKVQELDAQAEINLDNESKDLILVGHAIETAGQAGQIYRPLNWADHGIDGEIEFKDDTGKATGEKVYVQLKSGDSYTYERKRDGKEIFTIRNERHIEYWQKQAFEVYLVHRRSDGVIRWMNVSEYLRKRKDKKGKQIVFEGEPFTVYTLLKLRDEYLGGD